MRVTYCKKCNRFYSSPAISNYCRSCTSPTPEVPVDYDAFMKMSLNERYRLAYRLTNEYESLEAEYKQRV